MPTWPENTFANAVRLALTSIDADARLQHAVAFGDAPERGIEPRAVQRMRERADQAAAGLHRQLRIRIQRDDVSHRVSSDRSPWHDDEARVVAPRSRWLNSVSLPRLRSHPIQRPSPGFQRRSR